MTMPDSPSLPELLDQLWDFRDPAASERRFRDAAAAQTDDASRLVLLTQLARAQCLQRRFDEAHATLDMVETALTTSDASKPDTGVGLRLLLERGRVLNSAGDPDAARPLFEEAWERSRSAVGHSALAVDAAHMLAIVTDGEASVRWNERALDLAEASEDERAQRWRASLLNNLGWAYHDRGEYERALGHFERALSARQERGAQREVLIARWAVARCLRSLGRVEEALAEQRELSDAWEQLGELDGYVFEEIGECLLLLNRGDEAVRHFAAAHEQLGQDAWLRANEPDRLNRLAELGGLPPGAGR